MTTRKFQAIASVLRSEIPQSDIQKSSHWQHYTNERTLNRDGTVSGISGFGGRARRTWLHQKVHDHLQRRVLGKNHPVFEGPAYREASNYTKTQGRALDMDCLRHACTLDLLRAHHQKMSSPRNVTVIGDGQTNFVAAALASGLYQKIVSINLADVLLSDLELLEALPGLDKNSVQISNSAENLRSALKQPDTKVVLVPAQHAIELGACDIDLVVNIASFQEMNHDIVQSYFRFIRANFAWHYNCNRLRKVLPAGEILDFMTWDWQGAELLLDELCPWHQLWYTYLPPLLRPYDGPVQHRLAKFG